MKTFRILIPFLAALVLIFTGCSRKVYVYKMPPGHAKKVYGSKSAKHHAPGHNKHHKHPGRKK
jgi:hypothetical protein